MPQVVCPYCGRDAQLITGDALYPKREDLANRNFWVCWPCNAYVGCHPPSRRYKHNGTEPLGTPANHFLRRRRRDVHDLFDILWVRGKMKRNDAYKFLAKRLGIPPKKCHIAMFDMETCKRAQTILKELVVVFTEEDYESVSTYKKTLNKRRIEQGKRQSRPSVENSRENDSQ